MKSLLQSVFLFPLAALFFVSCQEVIDVDLNTAAPRLVITGTVTNEPGAFQVDISRTVNFDEPNAFPPVAGARVEIRDDAGNRFALAETAPGRYATTGIRQGEPGRTYTLTVEVDGQTFSAASTMPAVVPMLTLGYMRTTDYREREQLVLLPEFTDPEGTPNYYRFVQFNDGERRPQHFLLPDSYIDGNHVFPPFYADSVPARGTTVTLEMHGIDRPTYQYLYALQSTAGHGSVPANPDNNFGGAALGYFAAYTVERKSVVIE